MGNKTEIQWTDATWNPIRGCSVISPGCKRCYAMKQAHRFSGKGQAYEGLTQLTKGEVDGKKTKNPVWTGKVQFVEKHLADPLKWKTPRRIFVNSMSDLFHEGVTDEQLDQIFAVMADAHQHTFQILTKRPERMRDYLSVDNPRYTARKVFDLTKGTAGKFDCDIYWPLDNVWLGVSCENQKAADERIPLLLQTPAAVRWVSAEPLLGPIDLATAFRVREGVKQDALYGSEGIRWVVAGGESGPGARPMHPEWARSLRDQCQTADVPYFFKQWGAWLPSMYAPDQGFGVENVRLSRAGRIGAGCHVDLKEWPEDFTCMSRVGKKAAGRLLDGKEWNQYPEAR